MSDQAVPAVSPLVRLRAPAVALACVFAVAALIRLYDLGTASLWTDELFTRFYAKAGLHFLWTEGLRLEPTPPLYYSLISVWERVFGDGAVALRLPSVAGSLVGIGAAGLLARELFPGRASAVFAVLLLGLAPTNIYLAQEARSYALQGGALGLALLGFGRFLRDPRSKGALALYAAGGLGAVYFNIPSAFALIGFNVAALSAVMGRAPLIERRAYWRWLGVNVLVALACLPLAVTVLSPLTGAASGWLPPITRWSLEQFIGQTLAGPMPASRAMVLAEIGVPVLGALLLLPPWRPGRLALTVLVIPAAVFLILMVGISLKRPLILPRTIAWVLIPLAIVLGDVLARRLKLFALMLVGLSVAATAMYFANIRATKEDWASFLARLPGLDPAALIVLAPHTSPAALAVYAPQAGTPVRLSDDGPPVVETTVIPAMLGVKTIDLAEMQAAIEAGRRVWLIYRRPEYEWMREVTAKLPPPHLAVQDSEGSNPGTRALQW